MTLSRHRATVCACIIARDEEERLPAALASVAFCDEVVVVDSGSRDRTVELAREAGARVIEHPWHGFGVQRNVALDNATADWVLEVDADERVTPRLQRRDPGLSRRGAGRRGHLRRSVPRPADGRSARAVGEVPQVPAAAVPARRLPPRRAGHGARGPVGLRAHLGVRGRPRARARRDPRRGDPRRAGATPVWRPSS